MTAKKKERKGDSEGFADVAPHIREIIGEVLKLEREQLYSRRPRVVSDVANVVRDAVAKKYTHEQEGV